jgi:hypothetical protein
MSTTTLTGRGNLTKYAFWLGAVGLTEKENQVKMYKKYCFRFIASLKKYCFRYITSLKRIRIKKRSGSATLLHSVIT